MTIVPTHLYYIEGVKKGRPSSLLKKLVYKSGLLAERNLPYIHSVKHLSLLTGCDENYLLSIINRSNRTYSFYTVPKRSGGVRFIHAPDEELKKLQQWINAQILINVPVHPCCYSFHKDSSIKKCAEKHCGVKWLIKIDIENFFEMVSEIEIYKVFIKLGYKPIISLALARICTYEPRYLTGFYNKWVIYKKSKRLPFTSENARFFGRLPQGAPTSPMLSNLVLSSLDERINRLIKYKNGVYSRYADDIFISFGDKDINRVYLEKVIGRVTRYLEDFGYKANKTKIRLISPRALKIILGLNVGGEIVKLNSNYKKDLQCHFYGINKFGLISHASHRKFNSVLGMLEHIKGKVNFACQIEPDYGIPLKEELKNILNKNGLY
ncbi:RNA-directed DNA polymerase [Salmonella enterica subsp. enterica]|nr:RNA-directed DNA polymerase [Salmonella enterica subsp. enterica]